MDTARGLAPEFAELCLRNVMSRDVSRPATVLTKG